MDYDYFIEKLGKRFNIVNGELLESLTGEFLVTTDFIDYSINLNPITKTCNIIAPKKSYLGRKYLLRHSDCITLCCEWTDAHYGTDFNTVYKALSRKEFYNYFKVEGLSNLYLSNGFYKVTEPLPGDTLIYNWDNMSKETIIVHVGIYLEDDKILHHIPARFSSKDIVDYKKIIGCYRYG